MITPFGFVAYIIAYLGGFARKFFLFIYLLSVIITEKAGDSH